jgi:hypothetical protein
MTGVGFEVLFILARVTKSRAVLLLPLAGWGGLWACGRALAQSGDPQPVALVEAVDNAPAASIAMADLLYPGQIIELGNAGVLRLTYFDGCLGETIVGGRVIIGEMTSRIAGGTIRSQMRPCADVEIAATARSGEAGAVVERGAPPADIKSVDTIDALGIVTPADGSESGEEAVAPTLARDGTVPASDRSPTTPILASGLHEPADSAGPPAALPAGAAPAVDVLLLR